jgi:iron complex transport system permease protein
LKGHKLKTKWIFISLVLALFLLSFVLSVSFGPAGVSVKEIGRVLVQGLKEGDPASLIFWQIRLPRVLLAFLVGAALSIAGAILQGLFLNPLADPYVTGVSSGAALGATVAFFLHLAPIPWLSLFALIGGFLTLLFVYSLARRRGFVSIYVLLLAGVAVSSFFSALVSVLMVKSGRDLHALVYWLLGSFSGRSWPELKISLIVLPFLFIPFFFVQELNILLQGEERALELGVEVERVKKILFFVASFLTAIAVSAAGIIGFIGLVVPHLSRLLLGPDHRKVLILSLFLGASLMGLSDLLARVAFAPSEMPVGVVTSFFGAPFFIYLLKKRGG